jgi:hypothetical protein
MACRGCGKNHPWTPCPAVSKSMAEAAEIGYPEPRIVPVGLHGHVVWLCQTSKQFWEVEWFDQERTPIGRVYLIKGTYIPFLYDKQAMFLDESTYESPEEAAGVIGRAWMKLKDYQVARRCCLQFMSEWELAIREAVISVESGPAHPLMTDAVNLLSQAQAKIADYVEGKK